MAEKNAWTENHSRPREGIRNIKFASGPNGAAQDYTVRFVGDPVTFYKYFVNNRSAILSIDVDPNTTSMKKKFNVDPQLRHAVNVIDRKDGVLYLAEVPPSVLNPVKEWANAQAKRGRPSNPGGVVSVDFSITVKGVKKLTRYNVIALDPSTLTDDEQKFPLYDLQKLFKPTPENEIEAKLFGDQAGTTSVEQSQRAATVTAGKPVAQDLPF